MADNLQIRVRELAELNQNLGYEIGERERAEEVLRQTNESLERRVTERATTMTRLMDALRDEAADRERAEAALRQSQKMDAIGQLTGGIAHDFNNMLAAISGNLEMISRRTAEGRGNELERYIEAALTSTARAATLTHRLLAFSRHQSLDPRSTDINLVVLGMEELFRNTVGPAIRIETRLAPELHPTLCDPNQLENALLNLIINARDAMPDGGSLVIETANSVVAGPQGRARGRDRFAARRLCNVDYHRHRRRNDPRDPGAGLRPLLHDQAARSRHWTGPVDGLRVRATVGRQGIIAQQGGAGYHSNSVSALGSRSGAPARGARDRCDLRSASVASERGRAGGRRRAGPAYGRRRLARGYRLYRIDSR